MEYKLGRRYFATINWIMVAIILLISVVLLYFKILYGIIPVLGVAAYLFFKLYDLPKYKEIDDVYIKQSQNILELGFEKLGIMEEDVSSRDPIVLHGPTFDPIRYDPAIKKGKDKKVRSSNYEVSVFYFGKEQVYFYQKRFSIIDDEHNEVVDAYFYKDIVSLATSSEMTGYYNELLRRDAFVNLDTVTLHTTASNPIECAVEDFNKTSEKVYQLKEFLGIMKRQY